jgi:death on curing protein
VPEPVWVGLDVVLAIHEEQLAEHGGQAGVRDHGLLESALSRPLNRSQYSAATLVELAAAYAYGISRNHPFIDGNKRMSLVVAELFLALNGIELTASDDDCVLVFLRLAAGDLPEDVLAAWIESNSRPAA